MFRCCTCTEDIFPLDNRSNSLLCKCEPEIVSFFVAVHRSFEAPSRLPIETGTSV